MPKFCVAITEHYKHIFCIEANNASDAEDMVKALYESDEVKIDLDNDFDECEIEVYEAKPEYAYDSTITREMIDALTKNDPFSQLALISQQDKNGFIKKHIDIPNDMFDKLSEEDSYDEHEDLWDNLAAMVIGNAWCYESIDMQQTYPALGRMVPHGFTHVEVSVKPDLS